MIVALAKAQNQLAQKPKLAQEGPPESISILVNQNTITQDREALQRRKNLMTLNSLSMKITFILTITLHYT